MTRNLARVLLATALCVLSLSCAATPSQPAAPDAADIDRIVVTYSPSGDMAGSKLRTVTIDDPATVAAWLAALDAIPELPARGIRYISFVEGTPQHRIELCSGDAVRETHRMMGGRLDVRAHAGWAFYSGEDDEFSALVAAVTPVD